MAVAVTAVICLLLAAPLGVAMWRHLTGRTPPLPEEYAHYRPNRYPRR